MDAFSAYAGMSTAPKSEYNQTNLLQAHEEMFFDR